MAMIDINSAISSTVKRYLTSFATSIANKFYTKTQIDSTINPIQSSISDLQTKSIIGSSLDFLYAQIVNDVVFTPGMNLPFVGQVLNNLDISNGIFTLKRGKTYSLKFGIHDTSGAWLFFYNITDSKEIGSRGDDGGYNTLTTAIVKCDKDIQISCRVDRNTKTGVYVPLGSFLEVIEINRTTLIDPAEDARKIQFDYGDFKTNYVDGSAFTAGSNIKYNNIIKGNMIIDSNGGIVLKAGKTYKIDFGLQAYNITDGNTHFALYDQNTNAIISNTTQLWLFTSTAGYAYSNAGSSTTTIIPASDISLIVKEIGNRTFNIVLDGTYLSIQEMAQPYYFNYYKDSISSTTIFQGTINAIGDFNLLEDITNYDYLRVYSCVGANNFISVANIVKVSDVNYNYSQQFANSHYYDSSYNYSVIYHFKSKNVLRIDELRSGSPSDWNNPRIYRIEGIGYNYDNPYEDIITTSPDAALTDTQVDSDIASIWSGAGL